MSISQNVRFRMGIDKEDSSSSPPGERLTIELSDALKNGGWQPGDYDNWRDMGWCLPVSTGSERLAIYLAITEPGEWMLQVAPAYLPGAMAKLFGRQASATSESCYELARAVNGFLSSNKAETIGWCWDGFPEPDHPSEPQPVGNS